MLRVRLGEVSIEGTVMNLVRLLKVVGRVALMVLVRSTMVVQLRFELILREF